MVRTSFLAALALLAAVAAGNAQTSFVLPDTQHLGSIERAIVLGSTDLILPEDLPEHIREASHPHEVPATAYESAVDTAKRDVILRAFERAAYSHETAARILGLHPNYLHRLIRTMDLRSVIKGAARG